MMKILIIGSKGFIGSHAEQYFLQKGFEVYSCDVIVDYGKSNYAVIDATNSDFHALFQGAKFDICLNCSGAASVPESLKNPLRDFNLNTHNVFKILDAVRMFQPECKFINLSSAAVYGNPQQLPIKESDPLAPVSPYGIHKMQAEWVCKEFYECFGLASCNLRIFSAYGEGLKKQLFWDLYQKLKENDVIELYGTGKETRDFIYIDDVLSAIECVIRNEKVEYEIINIANGKETTIEEAANLFASFFPSKKKILFNNQVKPGDPLNWCADITRLREFGFNAMVNMETGIGKYARWVSEI